MISYQYDNELIAAFRQGDINAVRHLYEKYYRSICYYAESLVRNKQEAEDIAVEGFIKLLRKKDDFSSVAEIKSFLYTATRNACIDCYRKEKRHHSSHEEIRYISANAEAATDCEAISAEVMQAIYEEIENLPTQCGRVFRLLFFKGFSTEQAAQALQIKTKTVLNQKAKAIRLLRMALLRKEITGALLLLIFLH